MGTKLRFVILLGGLLSTASARLLASGVAGVDSPEPAPMILHSPTARNGTLEPATTGQMLEPAAAPRRDHLAYGINDLGEQLRFYFTRNWASEFRFVTGSASSDAGTVHSLVFGMREYRFFPEAHRWRLYVGAEEDYVKSTIRSFSPTDTNPLTQASNFGDVSGYDAGAFGGVEFRLFKRLSIDLDAGPYLFGLKEKATGVTGTSWDFVLDTAINFYIF